MAPDAEGGGVQRIEGTRWIIVPVDDNETFGRGPLRSAAGQEQG